MLIALYGQWCDRHARACKLALDVGVDERRLRLAEADVERLFQAVMKALASTDMTNEQREAFRVALAAELRGV